MKPIVIIGTGLAGYTLAKEFRKRDHTTPLTLITADGGQFYSKPLLSNGFTKGKSADALVAADVADMAEQLQATIHTKTAVRHINTAERQLKLDNGTLEYDRLVLCLGADPFRIPLEGSGADDVISVNSLDDYARFREALESAKRVMILGAGLIGCEFANDLRNGGFDVSVCDLADQPLGRLLPTEPAIALKDALTTAGITWHLGKGITKVDKVGDYYQVTLTDENIVEVDCILSAIGLRPKTRLAADSGLDVNRGITTNRLLQTSNPHIYALGDCLEVEGRVLPFVMPIMNGARALAKTLTGEPTNLHYPAMPVVVKTPAHPVVVSPPASEATGNWRIEKGKSGTAGFFENVAEDLLGFVLTGERVSEKQALTKLLPPVMD